MLEKPHGRLIEDLIATAPDPGRSRLRATMTRHLDFTDEQLELLVDRLSPTLQKSSDIVDMPPAPECRAVLRPCIPVAGPPIPWVAIPKPSVNRLRSSRRMGFGSLVHSMNKIVKCSA